mgnify:CR=1 FL=1
MGQISSTISCSRSALISSGVAGGEDAVADAVGAQVLDDLADLGVAVLRAFLADVDGHAEAGVARLLDERRELAVRVAPAAWRAARRCRSPTMPRERVADRLLDDDRVLPLVECSVHHQDQAGPDLRVLEARRGRGRARRP